MKINHNLTERDIRNFDVNYPSEHQIQQQEMKDSGLRFDKVITTTIYFYKTGQLNGSNYIKIPLRSNAFLNIENNDEYCFIWSILASLHPCNNNHPNRVSFYKRNFDGLNLQGFDFTSGLKCSDVRRFNELNNLSKNIFELRFYQDQNAWKHKLTPIEISKNNSDRVVEILIYKNHFALLKKFFLGDHHKNFICRRCLNSYTSENMLMLPKQKSEDDNETTIKTSPDSHLHWKYHLNPLYFRIYADFEADNEKVNSSIGNKTIDIYKQNPMPNGYRFISELEGVLKIDYYKSPLGYNNVDWFVNEDIKLENKMGFSFKNTKRDIFKTKEDGEDFKNNNVCRFC